MASSSGRSALQEVREWGRTPSSAEASGKPAAIGRTRCDHGLFCLSARPGHGHDSVPIGPN
jgi:hypothetical protein